MYIMMRYETWVAGCSAAMLTTAKPAVRVDAAWKRPSRNRKPGGRLVTTGLLSWGTLIGAKAEGEGYTAYIKNYEKDDIDAVKKD
jgi:hypothetical protein